MLVNFWVDIVCDGEWVSVDVAGDIYVPSGISVSERGDMGCLVMLGFSRTSHPLGILVCGSS